MKRVFLTLVFALLLMGGLTRDALPPPPPEQPAAQPSGEPQKETPIDYKITKKIASDLPAFTFELLGVNTNPDESYSYDAVKITTLIVTNSAGFRQTFPVATEIPYLDDYGFSLDDWNFDGFLDISLLQYPGGTMGNMPSYFWLWDREKNRFVENPELEEINGGNYMTPNAETKQIEAHSRGGYDEFFSTYYEVSGGNFLIVRQEHFFCTDYHSNDGTGREDLSIEYTVTQKIAASLPMFSFKLTLTVVQNDPNPSNNLCKVSKIDICDESGGHRQSFAVSTCIPGETDPPYGFSLEDRNADGFTDIRLWRDTGSSAGSHPSYYWLWDPEKGQFVESQAFEEISESHELGTANQ